MQIESNEKINDIKKSMQIRNPKVVFVLGGPGAGKGTQCVMLQNKFPIRHLSAGELLRKEMSNESSPHKELIDYYIKEGLIVPAEITVSLLGEAMIRDKTSKLFLIDGFPRAIQQYEMFKQILGTGYDKFMLFLDCPDDELIKRVMKRAQTSNVIRTDDNLNSIKKRLGVFHTQTTDVKNYFKDMDKLKLINANASVDDIHESIKSVLTPLLE